MASIRKCVLQTLQYGIACTYTFYSIVHTSVVLCCRYGVQHNTIQQKRPTYSPNLPRIKFLGGLKQSHGISSLIAIAEIGFCRPWRQPFSAFSRSTQLCIAAAEDGEPGYACDRVTVCVPYACDRVTVYVPYACECGVLCGGSVSP